MFSFTISCFILYSFAVYVLFCFSFFFFLMIRRPPRSTLFPTRRSSDLIRLDLSGRLNTFSCRQPQPRSSSPTSRSSKQHRRSEEHTSELQSLTNLVCRLLLEKKKKKVKNIY